MSNAKERKIDRSTWSAGPWDGEPDRIEFEHAGFPCLMRRNGSGAWCGYAAVPPGHPLHGKEYSDTNLDAHGSLTYAGACSGEICHVPKPGEPDDVWWFGFDCAHGCDVIPGFSRDWGDPEARYRDVPYVRAQVEGLAEQLTSAASAASAAPQGLPVGCHPGCAGGSEES